MATEMQEFLDLLSQAKDPETGYTGISYPASDYLKKPQRSAEFFEEVLVLDLGFNKYSYYSSIAENPNVPRNIIDKLVERASHRWEWRSLNGYYERQLAKTGLEVVQDYPLNLVDGASQSGEKVALLVFSAMNYMTEDLWHDLAGRGALDLSYSPDSIDGDHFGPASISMSPAEYLLSPGYFCNWIDKKKSLAIDWIIDSAEDRWGYEEDWFDDLYSEFNLAAVFVNGLANGEITSYNPKLAQEYLEQFDLDEEFSEIEVELLEFPYEGRRYQNLTQDQQISLVSNLILAHDNDVFFRHFEITSHLLNLVAVHPNTDNSALEMIYSHPANAIAQGKELRKVVASGGTI